MGIHRSYLFVPGDRPERFVKACAAGADAVVLDLEDAVAPEKKVDAREWVSSWLHDARPVFVRVNAVGTEWIDEDLKTLNKGGVAGVMLPKASSGQDIDYVSRRLPSGTTILPLIETAAGILQAFDIASRPNVQRLAFGSIDFQAETGIQGEESELLYARSHLVIVSAAAGILPPVDGVTTSTSDKERIVQDSQRAYRMGFGGKLCIHPDQIAMVHTGFRPNDIEVAWAQGVLKAAAAANGGAIRYEGKMVDRPVVERAKRVLELTHP